MADPTTDGPDPGQPAAGADGAPSTGAPAAPSRGTAATRGAAPAPGASPAPSPSPVGTGTPAGQGAPSPTDPNAPPAGPWRASFKDEAVKGARTLDKFADPEALAKGYVELEKLKAPGADAKPEELERWRNHIGVPKDPTGYIPPAAPDGKQWEPGALKLAQERFRAAGLMPWQAESVFKLYSEYTENQLEITRQGFAQGLKGLEEEWGADQFARKSTLSAKAVAYLEESSGMKGQLTEWLEATGQGDNPLWVRALAGVGELLEEHRLIDGTLPGMPGRADAQAELERIKADKAHPAHHPGAPGHAEAHARYMGLYRTVYGTKEVTPTAG